MIGGRVLVGSALAVLVTAGLAVHPARGAPDRRARHIVAQAATLGDFGGIGSFTPAAADPKLAAALARSGLDASGFRFTPSESGTAAAHTVTVAVRARSNQTAENAERGADTAVALPASNPSVSLTPVAYNLGVAVGWKRFALSGDVTKIDLAGQPGSHEAADVGVSYTAHRLSGRVSVASDQPLPNVPRLIAENPSYSIDAGGSYSLTHNLDLTAGVRYKSERDVDRLQTVNDTRRDSQAVYIGTSFHF